MKIRHVKFDQLTHDEIDAWSTIQRKYPVLRSPFFRPEFTEIVASARDDVEVAVLEDSGTPVGFFPFQRSWLNAGRSICGGLAEFQGLVASPEITFEPRELLRACGLSSWRFDHLSSAHASFEPYAWAVEDSPYIDLSGGFDPYITPRLNCNSLMTEYRQKGKKLARDIGPVRHEAHVSDPDVLATCIRWKGAHARRTGRVDILKNEWIVKLFHNTLAYKGKEFAPMMSVYYVGDQVASINFGIRSGDVFHTWMTSYNVELGNRSPGILHWLDLLKESESIGIRHILLGKGEEEHKRRLMSGVDRVSRGCVDLIPAVGVARRAWRQTRKSVKASPLRSSAKVPAQIMSHIVTWFEFR